MAFPDYNAPPLRPGAVLKLEPIVAGLDARACIQPLYIQMTAALVGWLRYHFADVTRIEYPTLTNYVYNPADREASKIQISSLAEWNPQKSGNRPAILVDRLDQEKDMQQRGIGDQFQGIRQGYYADFMHGQHVCHCVGGREGEAEFLAAEVWRDLKRFANLVRERLQIYRFLPIKIGKRTQLDEYREHYTVPVVIMYGYQESWNNTPLDESEIMNIRNTTSH